MRRGVVRELDLGDGEAGLEVGRALERRVERRGAAVPQRAAGRQQRARPAARRRRHARRRHRLQPHRPAQRVQPVRTTCSHEIGYDIHQ